MGSSLGQRNGNKKFTGPERPPGARMAAPGTAIVENERDGQHWGRHLPHGVTVARFESRVR